MNKIEAVTGNSTGTTHIDGKSNENVVPQNSFVSTLMA
jgi:hypothetical protein